jgi:hypothetical protein
VQAYNTKIQVFPNSIIAGMGGFTKRDFFEIEDAGRPRAGQGRLLDDAHVAATPAAADPAPARAGGRAARGRHAAGRGLARCHSCWSSGHATSGRVIAEHLIGQGWEATGVARSEETVAAFPGRGLAGRPHRP